MAPDNRLFFADADELSFSQDDFPSFAPVLGVAAFGVLGDGRSVPGFHMLLLLLFQSFVDGWIQF